MGARRFNQATYFEWLCGFVENKYEPVAAGSHRLLLKRLYELEFYAVLERDSDRVYEGLDMRNRYDDTRMYPDDRPDRFAPCNMLEAMIAMCDAVEETTMANAQYGDRTAKWFWLMIENAGLDTLDDISYTHDTDDYITSVIARINERRYQANGDGSFFPLRNPRADMREVDLWYQFQWYITENFNGDW